MLLLHSFVVKYVLYNIVFPRNLAAPRIIAALKITPHISVDRSRINAPLEMTPRGKGSIQFKVLVVRIRATQAHVSH